MAYSQRGEGEVTMSNSHGELFGEIGKLVLAANAGETIDLNAKSEELAQRYNELGLSEDVIARAIARSIGAIGFTIAKITSGEDLPVGEGEPVSFDAVNKVGSKLFPSGVRLAVLS
jgi:hypothetical protein